MSVWNSSSDERFSGKIHFVELLPGSVPKVLAAGEVGLLRADEQVFAAMLDGWRAQMLARGLTTATIKGMCGTVTRFQEHTNEYPWTWQAHHVDEYFADRRSLVDKPMSLSTLRCYSGSIRAFCAYVTDGRYGWAEFCERIFDDVPSQVVFEWNSPRAQHRRCCARRAAGIHQGRTSSILRCR